MTMMTSVPRAFQLLDKEPEHQLLINSLQQEFKHYLKQVHRHTFHQDRRYTQTQYFTSSMAWSKTSKDFCSRFTDAYFTRVANTHAFRASLPVAKMFKQCLPTLSAKSKATAHTHPNTYINRYRHIKLVLSDFYRDPEITFFDQMRQPMMMYRWVSLVIGWFWSFLKSKWNSINNPCDAFPNETGDSARKRYMDEFYPLRIYGLYKTDGCRGEVEKSEVERKIMNTKITHAVCTND